jgi:single-strand DNA-binding protein
LPEQNLVIIAGRVTRDSEVRYTPSTGKAVCSFDIAISKRFRDSISGEWKDADPVFVPIIAWGDLAERCGERAKKGAPVFVEGRLQSSSWEDKETGKKRSKLEIVASRVQFLAKAASAGQSAIGGGDGDVVIRSKISEDEGEYASSPKAKKAGGDFTIGSKISDDDEGYAPKAKKFGGKSAIGAKVSDDGEEYPAKGSDNDYKDEDDIPF